MTSVYLITGASSGIGAAIAARAVSGGARVAICGRRREQLESVAASTGAVAYVADVTSRSDTERLVAQVTEEHGRLDGLVACAGTMRAGGIRELTGDDWDITIATNLTSVFLLAQAALGHLVQSRGAFVTIGSIAGLRAPSGMSAYAAAKAGAAMLTSVIAAEFGPRGVRANTVAPGWTRTEMADEEMRAFGGPFGLTVEDSYRAVTALVPQRRPATADEIADAALWLLGPGSSYVNGAVLTVDGGTTVIDPGAVPFDFEVRPRET